ncbi:MAG: DUF3450 domain-containing protein [Pseudomonadota bacterium]
MKRCKSSSRRVGLALLAGSLIAASGSVFAQTVDQVLQAQDRRLNLAQQSQERINAVVEGTRSLEDQYRAINKEIDGLKVYNRLMVAQTNGQQAVLEDIGLSMDQVDVINRQIFPLMEKMIDALEQSINVDVPFLMDERTNRVNELKNIMERSDVSVAEKFRKVMEAYQIENDYGSGLDVYVETHEFDGVVRDFNVLRVGRIGLYMQSEDEEVTARWSMESDSWEEADDARNEVKKAIQMEKALIAPQLLLLPVKAATEGS